MADEGVKKPKLSPLASKIINIAVDVVVALVLVFALILSISAIQSKKSSYGNYTAVFGHAYVAVLSDSMENDSYTPIDGKLKGFNKGDLIKIKILDDDEKKSLEVGDIISFYFEMYDSEHYDYEDSKFKLNTHRIIAVNTDSDGNVVNYTTQGDKVSGTSTTESVELENVVGLYEGKASGIGYVFQFMKTSLGFFVCIILPTLLVVVYCAVNLVLVILKERKVQTAEAAVEEEKKRAELEEEIRQKLLAEMSANSSENAANEDKTDGDGNREVTTEEPADGGEDTAEKDDKQD